LEGRGEGRRNEGSKKEVKWGENRSEKKRHQIGGGYLGYVIVDEGRDASKEYHCSRAGGTDGGKGKGVGAERPQVIGASELWGGHRTAGGCIVNNGCKRETPSKEEQKKKGSKRTGLRREKH